MKKHPQTSLIHPDYTPPAGFGAINPAIEHASTVLFKNVAAMRSRDWKTNAGYTYGLHPPPLRLKKNLRRSRAANLACCSQAACQPLPTSTSRC
jgi:cystathionine beta-lyase/cystathionine gamma-synthase